MAPRDGQVIRSLRAPEGERYAVLFTYAPGEPPAWPPPPSYARLYGQTVAAIHAGLDAFAPAHARFPLDLDYLIERPLQTILPFLADRPEDAQYLQHLADRLTARVRALEGGLEHGACHGDCHGGNCHLAAPDQLTFFDFDCCGPGWRVFDLATFRWSIALNELDETLWSAFEAGYTSWRQLPELDWAAVPLFVLIRHLWLLGLHTSNGDDWGYAWLDRHYFDRGLKFLREWEAAHLAAQAPVHENADGGEPPEHNRQAVGTAHREQP
jgi:Ser/Thr protein kinase RdoA (MazF antagonist)